MTDAALAPTERGLSPAAIAWLIAGAALSFVAFLAAMAYQPELSAGSDRGAHALSRSPVGFAALTELLRADGSDVRFSRLQNPAARVVPADALFVLTPGATTAPQQLSRLARGRRVLLILPKWVTAPDPLRRNRVTKVGVLPPTVARDQAAAILAAEKADGTVELSSDGGASPSRGPTISEATGIHDLGLAPAALKPVEALRTLSGSATQPLAVDERGRALIATGVKSVGYVVADPDLLNNQGLTDLQGARTAVALVEGLADGGPVVFDLTLPGLAGKRSPLKLAFAPPFLPATVCAVVLAALIGLMARGRFGAVRTAGRAYGFGKRALTDSAASLLAVAGREPRLAGRYAELVRAQVIEAIGLAEGGGREAQDQALDCIGVDRGADAWSQIAQDSRTVTTRAGLMAFADRAHGWRTEMMRGRG